MDLSKKYKKITDAKYPDVGNFINYHLQSNKLSKAQLARDLGISPTTLNDYYKNTIEKRIGNLKDNFKTKITRHLISIVKDLGITLKKNKNILPIYGFP